MVNGEWLTDKCRSARTLINHYTIITWVYLNLVERQTLRVSVVDSESPQTQLQFRSRVAVYAQKPEAQFLRKNQGMANVELAGP